MNNLNALISFKNNLYLKQASCEISTYLYTSIYKHITHEAQKYLEILRALQNKEALPQNDTEDDFWNHLMLEHAKVIRGLLDPKEDEMFEDAQAFTQIFTKILSDEMENSAKEATFELSNYKAYLTEGIIECKLQSLMLPLFTDHVLREANHFIRILEQK